jgi:anti-sigma regulatory factor (Ser/Thr protein kinase)
VEHLAPHELPPRVIHAVELVLEETLLNAARHAFPDGGQHAIDVAVRVEADEVVLEFGDDGIEFDPRARPSPAPASCLADATVGGLGLRLVRANARRIDYRRDAGRNALTIAVGRH